MRSPSSGRLSPKYQGDPDFIRGRDSVQAVAGEAAEHVVDSTAILLLHPLCLRVARVTAAATWLERYGFSVTHCRRIRLTDEHLQRIWKYQIAGHDPRRVRVVSQMLTHGPALVLAVVDEAPAGEPATSRLRVLKGPADPARAAPHNLRTHLGAANMFNNLVHTCDGPDELIREAAVLFGSEVDTLWRNSLMAIRQPLRDAGARVPHDLPKAPMPDGISLAHVALRLRRLLLSRLRVSLARVSDHLVASLAGRIDREAAWISGQSPARPVETLAGFRQLFRPSSIPFQTILARGSGKASERAAVIAFVEIERALFASDFDAERLEESAARAGLSLSVRDRLVFSTQSLSIQYRGD